MVKRSISTKIYITAFILLIFVVSLYIGNLSFARNNPGGLDLLANWSGTRSLIESGTNPYTEQAASQIQTAVTETVPGTTDEYRFVLPLFSILFLGPVALFKDFIVARALWMTTLEVALLLTGYLVAGWMTRKRSWILTIVATLVVSANYVAVGAVLDGSMVIIGLVMLVLAITLIQKKQDEAAGLVLALSLVKPDLVYPIIFILLVWVLWQKRLTIFWWFLVAFFLAVGFSMVLVPAWPIYYIQSLGEFSSRNPISITEGATALQLRLIVLKNLAILTFVVVEWFLVRIQGPRRFLWKNSLILNLSVWIGSAGFVENSILVIPALLTATGLLMEARAKRNITWMLVLPVVLGLAGWLFSSLIPLLPAAWLGSWLTILLPLVVLIMLYWSRWWIIRNEKFHDNYFES